MFSLRNKIIIYCPGMSRLHRKDVHFSYSLNMINIKLFILESQDPCD